MAKTIDIFGERFEVKTPRKNKLSLEQTIRHLDHYSGRDIWDCYERPSRSKENIYEKWLKWYSDAPENALDMFGVSSYNCMQFSLQALYCDSKGNYYLLIITASHNYATLIELL